MNIIEFKNYVLEEKSGFVVPINMLEEISNYKMLDRIYFYSLELFIYILIYVL